MDRFLLIIQTFTSRRLSNKANLLADTMAALSSWPEAACAKPVGSVTISKIIFGATIRRFFSLAIKHRAHWGICWHPAKRLCASGDKKYRCARTFVRRTSIQGHADGQELVSWIKERSPIHAGIFLTHGEEQSLEGLKADLAEAQVPENLIHCPKLDDEIYLEGAAPTYRKNEISRRLQPEWVGKLDWHNDFRSIVDRFARAA